MAQAVAGRADGGEEVDAIVAEEPLVLGNQSGIQKSGWNLFEGDRVMAEQVGTWRLIE